MNTEHALEPFFWGFCLFLVMEDAFLVLFCSGK